MGHNQTGDTFDEMVYSYNTCNESIDLCIGLVTRISPCFKKFTVTQAKKGIYHHKHQQPTPMKQRKPLHDEENTGNSVFFFYDHPVKKQVVVGTNSEDANMMSPKEEQSVTTVDGIPQGPTNNLINPYDQKAQKSYADVVCNN